MEQQILQLLRDNPNGLTFSKIAEKCGTTTYMVRSWVFVLKSKKQVEIIDVGQAKLVRLKI